MIYTYIVYITYFKEDILKEFKYAGNIITANPIAFQDFEEMARATAWCEFTKIDSESHVEDKRVVLLNAQKADEIFA